MNQKPFKKRKVKEIDCGKYITRAREKGKINQTQLGKLIKVPATNISRYELNKTKMTLNMFLESCRGLGITDFNEIFKEEIEINKEVSLEGLIKEYEEQKRKRRIEAKKKREASGKKKAGRPKKGSRQKPGEEFGGKF